MLRLTTAQWIEVVAYSLLVVFWLSVFVITLASFLFRIDALTSRTFKRAHAAFLFISAVLFLDSAYWAIANTSRVGIIAPEVEVLLRRPIAVTTVKAAVLLSSIVFLWVVIRLGKDIRSRIASVYYHGLIDQIGDAIGILDKDGVVRIWNAGAEQLFGFAREFACGKHINSFLVPDDEQLRESTRQELVKARKERRAVRYTQPRRTSRESVVLVDIVSSPILDEDGKFEGYFGIMRPAIVASSANPPTSAAVTAPAMEDRHGPN